MFGDVATAKLLDRKPAYKKASVDSHPLARTFSDCLEEYIREINVENLCQNSTTVSVSHENMFCSSVPRDLAGNGRCDTECDHADKRDASYGILQDADAFVLAQSVGKISQPKEIKGSEIDSTKRFVSDASRNRMPCIILGDRSSGAQILCSETLLTKRVLSFDTDTIAACSIHGNLAVSSSANGAAIVWDVRTGKEAMKFSGHADSVTCVAIMSCGKTAVTGSVDSTLKTWDMASGAVGLDLFGHTDWIYSCALTPDDRMLVSASADKSLRIWDTSTGKSVRKLTGHDGSVICCSIIDDGSVVLSGSRDKTARIWDVMTGKSRFILSGHDDWVLSCAIIKNTLAATGSADGTIMLWALSTGEVRQVFQSLGSWVNALLPISDENRLLSISEDRRVCIWDSETGDLKRSVVLPSVPMVAAISKAERQKLTGVPESLIATAAWDYSGSVQDSPSKTSDFLLRQETSPVSMRGSIRSLSNLIDVRPSITIPPSPALPRMQSHSEASSGLSSPSSRTSSVSSNTSFIDDGPRNLELKFEHVVGDAAVTKGLYWEWLIARPRKLASPFAKWRQKKSSIDKHDSQVQNCRHR